MSRQMDGCCDRFVCHMMAVVMRFSILVQFGKEMAPIKSILHDCLKTNICN